MRPATAAPMSRLTTTTKGGRPNGVLHDHGHEDVALQDLDDDVDDGHEQGQLRAALDEGDDERGHRADGWTDDGDDLREAGDDAEQQARCPDPSTK